MTDVPKELVESISEILAESLKSTLPAVTATSGDLGGIRVNSQSKPPQFSMKEFNSSDGTSVGDYFKRFDWALDISRITNDLHAKYVRVHMGAELNNESKFLVAPETPESKTYEQICTLLISHFDTPKNKYSESVRFRQLVQNKSESVANFGTKCKRHVDQILPFTQKVGEEISSNTTPRPNDEEQQSRKHVRFHEANENTGNGSNVQPAPIAPPPEPLQPAPIAPPEPSKAPARAPQPVTLRRSNRLHKPIQRYAP